MFEKVAGTVFMILLMLSISIVGLGFFMRESIKFEKAEFKKYKEAQDEELKKQNEELSNYYTADQK